MASAKSRISLFLFLFLFFFFISVSSQSIDEESSDGGRVLGRVLMTSFKETQSDGNITFECSPSGPCIACLYSEKKEEKFRCSETGYRIPLKCVEEVIGSKEKVSKKVQKGRSNLQSTGIDDEEKAEVLPRDTEELTNSVHRNLLDDSSTANAKGKSQDYITYRSCIPAIDEEKISVLGFEVLMLGFLLSSAFFIFLRRKQSVAVSGAVRLPTISRF